MLCVQQLGYIFYFSNIWVHDILAGNKPRPTISRNYTLEIVQFVARLKNAGPEPVIALITDYADDVSAIADRIFERRDDITTYPMWLIGETLNYYLLPNR